MGGCCWWMSFSSIVELNIYCATRFASFYIKNILHVHILHVVYTVYGIHVCVNMKLSIVSFKMYIYNIHAG